MKKNDITRPLLRRAARAVLANKLGYRVATDDRRQGVTPGARLLISKEGSEETRVAVRTATSRRVRLTRRDDGRWRTIPDVALVVVAVAARDPSDGIEVLGFDSQVIIDCFDAALRNLPDNTSTDAPVIVALDAKARGGRAHSVSKSLKSKAAWQYTLPINDPLLKEPARSQSQESFVERVKREFAELNGVDVDKVAVEFKIIS